MSMFMLEGTVIVLVVTVLDEVVVRPSFCCGAAGLEDDEGVHLKMVGGR